MTNTLENPSEFENEIIIVDDTDENLELLVEILQKIGYNIRTANSGSLALQSIHAKLPSIIILDVKMPVMDGFEICRILKSDEKTQAIPIIFISALDDENSKTKGFEAGAVDFICKPFFEDEVLARVKTHIELRRMQLNTEIHNVKLSNEIIDRIKAEESLLNELNERKKVEEALKITISKLEKSQLSTLNLMDDIRAEIDERKLAEEKQRESENKFRKIYQDGPLGMVIMNSDFYFSMANNMFCQMIGYTEEELNNLTFKDITHPFYIQEDTENTTKLINGEISIYKTEKQYIRKDKKIIWGSLTATANYDDDGHLLYVLGMVEDITERKITEEALRESLSLHRAIFKASPDDITISDLDGKVLMVSDEALVMFGYKREEDMIGKSVTDFIIPEERDRAIYRIAQMMIGNISGPREYHGLRKDGSIFEIEINSEFIRGENEIPKSIVFIARDISQRKEAEEALRISEERFRTLVDSMDELIFSLDCNQRHTGIYGHWAEKAGLKPEDFLGKTARDIFGESLAKVHESANIKALAGKSTIYDWSITNTESTTYFQTSVSPLHDGNGNIIGLVGVGRDITDRKLVEIKLKEALIEAQWFREALDHVSSYIYIKDFNSRYIYANKPTLNLFGCSAEEAIGMSDSQFFRTEELKRLRETDSRVFKGENTNEEIEFIDKEGNLHIYLEIKTPIYLESDNNTISGLLGISTDITEIRQAEEKVQKISRHFQSLIEKAPDGIVLLNSEFKFTYASPSARSIFGYEASDEMNMLPNEITHPDDLNDVLNLMQQILTNPAFVPTLQYRIADKNGDWKWIESTFSNLLADSSVESIIINFRDITERKKAEEKEQLAHLRLRRFVDSNIVGIVIATADGKIIETNDYYLNMLGYTRQDYESGLLDWRSITPPEWLAKDEKAIQEMQEKGTCTPYEKEYIHRNGKRIVVLITDTLLPGEEGQIAGFILDITDRKLAEESLKDNNLFLQTFLNAIPAPVYYKDNKCRYTGINKSYKEFFGKKAEEIIGKTIQETSLLEFPEIAYTKDMELLQNPGLQIYEMQIKNGNDEIHDAVIHKASIIDSAGRISGLVGVILDITERKQIEVSLRESEERFKHLVWNMQVGVLLQGSQAEILLSNPKALELLGLSEEQLLGITSFDPSWNVIHEDGTDFPGTKHPVPQAIESRKSIRNTIMGVYRPVSNDRVWLLVDAEPQLNDDGTVRQVVCTFIDITELKKAEDENLKLNAQLEQKVIERTAQLQATNKELESFSYSVSHDLRAPLRSIDGFSQMLLSNYADQIDNKGQDYLQRVRNAAQRMGLLIDDMLQLSRIIHFDIKFVKTNLSIIAKSIMEELKNSAPERNVEFKIEENMFVLGDTNLLRIMLNNLIGNAWKYSGKNQITKIEFSFILQNNETIFYIYDNGVGFDMKYSNKLFGAFQRLHSNTEFEGTGIGLATVQRIINRHNGKIWAESEINKGATFYFTINT